MKRALPTEALLLTLALAGCRNEPAPTAASAPSVAATTGSRKLKIDPVLLTSERVTTVVAEQRSPSEVLEFPGEVRASLGAAEVGALVAGRVATVLAVEGARVETGQILAWLDAPEVARATADVLRARARAASAKTKLLRQQELDSQQATSKSALDEARTEAEVARAELLAARTLLRNLGGAEPASDVDGNEGSLSARVALRAPVAGTIIRRDAVLGSAVTPERTLFWLNGASPPFVIAKVPEGMLLPAEGESATLTLRGSNAACKAVVRGGPGVVERETRSIDVRLEPDGACTGLIPGAYLDVAFARTGRSGAQVLVVPRESVVDVHGASVAFVVGPSAGEILVRPVRIAQQVGAELVLESGIEPGENVVNRGAVLLKGELLRAELTGGQP